MTKRKLFFLAPLALLVPSVAGAQTENQAAAEALFDEARKLAKAGDYATACPKFAESQRLDGAVGTLLYLADCYEQIGKTASAWAAFREASSTAKHAGQAARARVAEEHARELEARLSRLIVRFPSTPGLVVKRGGTTLALAASGVAFPVDPGAHEITAEAPGKKRWSTRIEIKGPGETALLIPELESEPGATAPAAPAPSSAPPAASNLAPSAPHPATPPPVPRATSPLRLAGFIGIGAGAISLGAGAFFGSKAWSGYADRKDFCTGNQCDQRGIDLTREARSQANLSTLLVGAGLLLGGAGATLLVLGKPDREIAIAPTFEPSSAGITLRGSL